MSRPIRSGPVLRLIRLPNLFTAAADSLSGFLLCGGSTGSPERWGPLVVASMAIYAAGIALNDLLDLPLDRVERPNRPLPSGELTSKFAGRLILVAFGIGLAASAVAGPRAASVAALLIGCVVGYDALLRRTAVGPWTMGLCRAANVLLGMSIHPALGGPWCWSFAASYGLFVAGITWISRHENHRGRRLEPTLGASLQLAALAVIGFLTTRSGIFPPPRLDLPGSPLLGQIVLAAIAVRIMTASVRAARDPRPETLKHAVRTGIFSLIWLHAALVTAVRGPIVALLIVGLWIPALIASRRIEST